MNGPDTDINYKSEVFLCIFSMYLYISVRHSVTQLNPIRRKFFKILSSWITSCFNYEPCDSQHLVLEREGRFIFSPITVQHKVQSRSWARQAVCCVFVLKTASRYNVLNANNTKSGTFKTRMCRRLWGGADQALFRGIERIPQHTHAPRISITYDGVLCFQCEMPQRFRTRKRCFRK